VKWELPGFARRIINSAPDLNDQPDEIQAVSGVLGSMAVHLLLLVIWLFFQDGWFGRMMLALPRKTVPIEIVIQTTSILPERMVVPLDGAKDQERVDSAGLQESKEPVKDAKFQSDKNLQAGSKERPMGTAPRPQVNAQQRMSDKAMVQREARTGSVEARPPKSANDVARMGGSSASSKVASLAKKKANQPEPAMESERVEDIEDLGGELVFRKVAAGVAAPVKVSEKVGSGKKQKDLEDSGEDTAEEGKQASKTDGGLEQNGKQGVNASKTPMAAYMKSVSRAIGARWNLLIKSRMDSLETGMAKVRFRVAADGSVREVMLEQSTANREFSDLCQDVVRQAQLDPPPAEAKTLLKNGLLEIPFTFSLY
jgi:TonB family protein